MDNFVLNITHPLVIDLFFDFLFFIRVLTKARIQEVTTENSFREVVCPDDIFLSLIFAEYITDLKKYPFDQRLYA